MHNSGLYMKKMNSMKSHASFRENNLVDDDKNTVKEYHKIHININ